MAATFRETPEGLEIPLPSRLPWPALLFLLAWFAMWLVGGVLQIGALFRAASGSERELQLMFLAGWFVALLVVSVILVRGFLTLQYVVVRADAILHRWWALGLTFTRRYDPSAVRSLRTFGTPVSRGSPFADTRWVSSSGLAFTYGARTIRIATSLRREDLEAVIAEVVRRHPGLARPAVASVPGPAILGGGSGWVVPSGLRSHWRESGEGVEIVVGESRAWSSRLKPLVQLAMIGAFAAFFLRHEWDAAMLGFVRVFVAIGVLAALQSLLWVWLGRERLRLETERLVVAREVLGLGPRRVVPLGAIRELRVEAERRRKEDTVSDLRLPWSGPGTLRIVTATKTVRFGDHLDEAEASLIAAELKRRHPSLPAIEAEPEVLSTRKESV